MHGGDDKSELGRLLTEIWRRPYVGDALRLACWRYVKRVHVASFVTSHKPAAKRD